MPKAYLMNSPLLTNYGEFIYEKVTPEQAHRELLLGFVSAIGHEATAQLLTKLLKLKVEPNRIQVSMVADDIAIIFKVKTRLPEGRVLTEEELNKVEYELGKLTCVRTY